MLGVKVHCMGKKAYEPQNGATCVFNFSECPSPMDPILFLVVAGSHKLRILSTTVHSVLINRAHHLKCH